MAPAKIFLIGHRGWIGQQVVKIFQTHQDMSLSSTGSQNQVISTTPTPQIITRENFRADNEAQVESALNEIQPTHVISLIGRTYGTVGTQKFNTIDYLEQPGTLVENVRDNLFAPLVLAKLCQSRNIHLTYLGTGCIFQYDSNNHPVEEEKNGFTEEEFPNFFGSSYSVVKGFTDRMMHLYPDTVLNVRIRMPITADASPRNFITKITTYPKICSIKNSMSVLPELLPLMIDMALHQVTGTINLTNPGLISHNEILTMYREIIDPTFQWTNFTQEEQNQILAANRSNNFLDTSLLQSKYPQVKSIDQSVRWILNQMKNNKINTIK